jgi:formylglycine-generating enzyme required for sulfatase activity
MGSPKTEEGRNFREGPQTEVTLTTGFYMSKFLVTQGEYLALMRTNTSYCTGDTNRPVEACGWFKATNYCGRLTARERQAKRLPANWCYRLPTEAEWEYACRAGTTTRFSFGDDPGYTNLTKYGWWHENSRSTNKPPGQSYFVLGRYYQTHPVGQKLPNPWGLYDMHGTVSEWCQDWFGRYPGGSVTNWQGPPTGKERVIRNGSWLDNASALRSAMRWEAPPKNVSGIYGFRPVLAPVGL